MPRGDHLRNARDRASFAAYMTNVLGQLCSEVLPALTAAYREALAAEEADAGLQRARRMEAARALATRHCARLGCTSATAYGLPEPSHKVCTGCRVVRYCGAACQKKDWSAHKAACAALAAEAAAENAH